MEGGVMGLSNEDTKDLVKLIGSETFDLKAAKYALLLNTTEGNFLYLITEDKKHCICIEAQLIEGMFKKKTSTKPMTGVV